LSIICNTICLQFSLYRAPLQCLGLFLLISSRIFDFKCHSYLIPLYNINWLPRDPISKIYFLNYINSNEFTCNIQKNMLSGYL
jgi:hypothetical protein